MANYYTEFSILVECHNKEQQDWLIQHLREEEEDGGFYAEEQRDDVWITGESGDLDILLDVIAEFQRTFSITEAQIITWSNTCSRPMVDAFGGGAAVVYRGEYVTIDCFEWANDLARRWQAGCDVTPFKLFSKWDN